MQLNKFIGETREAYVLMAVLVQSIVSCKSTKHARLRIRIKRKGIAKKSIRKKGRRQIEGMDKRMYWWAVVGDEEYEREQMTFAGTAAASVAATTLVGRWRHTSGEHRRWHATGTR